MNYVTVETILGKLKSLTRKDGFDETEVIEAIGAAMGFMRVVNIQEPHVAFMEVANYTASLPQGFTYEIQIAKNNLWSCEDNSAATPECIGNSYDNCAGKCITPDFEPQPEYTNGCIPCGQTATSRFPDDKGFVDCFSACRSNDHPANLAGYPVPLDSQGVPMIDVDLSYYRPYFDTVLPINGWAEVINRNVEVWSIISKSTHNYAPAMGHTSPHNAIYKETSDKYTIIGTEVKFLRLSFEKGFISLSYFKDPTDARGYPLIPNNESYIEAVVDYVKWKHYEYDFERGIEGAQNRMTYYKQQWEKRSGQAISWAKMPKTRGDWNQIANDLHNLIPDFQDDFMQDFGKNNQ